MKKRVVARTVVISIICMLLFGAYAYYQIDKYEEGMAEIYSEEQDGYVALVSEKIKSGDKVVEDAQDTVELLKSADDHYWTLDDKSTILYIKNVTETNVYRNVAPEKYYKTETAKKFIESLSDDEITHSIIDIDNKKYIASGTLINYGEQSLRMILLTDYQILFTNNAYLSNKIFLEIAVVAVAVIFVVTMIMMAIYISQQNKKSASILEENKELAEKLEMITSLEEVRNALIANMKHVPGEEAISEKAVEPTPVAEAEIAEPEIAEPEIAEPEIAEPEIAEPEIEETVVETAAEESAVPVEEQEEAPVEEKNIDIDYANSKIIRGRENIDKLLDGIEDREIYPTTVLACKLRDISAAEYFLEMKDIFKRDAVWIEVNEGDLMLVFANRRKDFVMDFVWKHVVYQNTVRAYKVFGIDDSNKVADVVSQIEEFYRG